MILAPAHGTQETDITDIDGLATDAVRPCIPDSAIRHKMIGSQFRLRHLYKNRDEVARECGVGLPDVVYDSGPNARKILRGLPYIITYSVDAEERREGVSNRSTVGGWVAVHMRYVTKRR